MSNELETVNHAGGEVAGTQPSWNLFYWCYLCWCF